MELLESHDGTEFRKLSDALKQAKELAPTRNLIAHNPLVLEIYELADGSLFHREVIASLHNERRIALPELRDFAAKADALSSDLYQYSSSVFKVLGDKASA